MLEGGCQREGRMVQKTGLEIERKCFSLVTRQTPTELSPTRKFCTLMSVRNLLLCERVDTCDVENSTRLQSRSRTRLNPTREWGQNAILEE